MEPKTGHKIVFTTLVLLVMIFIGGFVYVYYSDQSTNVVSLKKAAPVYAPLPPPTPSSANAPEGVVVESLDTPVAAGANTSMIINSNNGSLCTITVSYNGVVSKDSGLMPKTADGYGNVTWSWTVPLSAPSGTWPIVVSCSFHGRQGVYDASLQVSPPS